MSKQDISPENIVSLVDTILKTKDPSAVGLKRILKKKEDEYNDFPLRQLELEEFDSPEKKPKTFNDDERHLLTLEKKVADLQLELKKQKTKASQALQTAYSKGKDEGVELGRKEGVDTTTGQYEKKIDLLQQRFAGIFSELETAKNAIFGNAEYMLLKLVNQMVRKIIDQEVSVNRNVVLSVLKRALNYIGHRDKMVIRVAPGDLERVTGRKNFWFPVSERLNDVVIEPDERIEPGGCIIESNSGLVDARLGVQFEELTDIIDKTWEEVTKASESDDVDNDETPTRDTETI